MAIKGRKSVERRKTKEEERRQRRTVECYNLMPDFNLYLWALLQSYLPSPIPKYSRI